MSFLRQRIRRAVNGRAGKRGHYSCSPTAEAVREVDRPGGTRAGDPRLPFQTSLFELEPIWDKRKLANGRPY
jgi:hypothetical protein